MLRRSKRQAERVQELALATEPNPISNSKRVFEDDLSEDDGVEDDGVEGDEYLPTVVDDADYLVDDEAEDEEAFEDEADFERMLQAIKKSAATKVKRRRQTLPARRDSNGDRIWKAIVIQYHGGSLGILIAAINSMVDKLRCAGLFEERLTFSVGKRMEQAKKVTRESLSNVGGLFCPQMAQMYSHMNCDSQVQFILGPMTLEQKAICGLPHETGQELLYLPPPKHQSDLKQTGYYLMLLVDEHANVVWVYDGSRTAIKGIKVRIFTYDNTKDAANCGILLTEDAKGNHLRTLLQKGFTVHIRPIFLIGHHEASAARVVSVEAQMADVFNTFDTDGVAHGNYRSQKIFDEYDEGVPDDMKDVEYGKLERVHQPTQGREKGSSPP